jgi:hypothetical protein
MLMSISMLNIGKAFLYIFILRKGTDWNSYMIVYGLASLELQETSCPAITGNFDFMVIDWAGSGLLSNRASWGIDL